MIKAPRLQLTKPKKLQNLTNSNKLKIVECSNRSSSKDKQSDGNLHLKSLRSAWLNHLGQDRVLLLLKNQSLKKMKTKMTIAMIHLVVT